MAEPADVPHALLDRAVEDELMARSLLPVKGVTDAGIGFHVQQAVEKSLKAVLATKKVEYPYSHDLDGLLRLCEKHRIEVPDDLSGVGRMSVFGVTLRYDASPTAQLDRDQALTWAATAITWAKNTIATNKQPTTGQQPTAEPEPD